MLNSRLASFVFNFVDPFILKIKILNLLPPLS